MACKQNTNNTCGRATTTRHYCRGKHRSRDPKHLSTVTVDSVLDLDISAHKNFDIHLQHNGATLHFKHLKTGRKGILCVQNATSNDLSVKNVDACGIDVATFGGIFPLTIVPEQILFVEYYASTLSLVLRIRLSDMAQALVLESLELEGTNAAVAVFQINVTSAVGFNISDFTYTVSGTPTTFTVSDATVQTNGTLRLEGATNDTNDWSVADTVVTVSYTPTPQSDCGSTESFSLMNDWVQAFTSTVHLAA